MRLFFLPQFNLGTLFVVFLIVCECAFTHGDYQFTANQNTNGKVDDPKYEISELINWITENEGEINDAQEIRELNDDRETDLNPYGVFANRDISEGETLLNIPLKMVFGGDSFCEIMMGLIDELEWRDDSEFDPYFDHLITFYQRTQIDEWSRHAKYVLYKILGMDLPPDGILFNEQFDTHKICDFDSRYKKFPFWSWRLLDIISNGDFGLVPFSDLYKHRNGKWQNINPPFECDDGVCFTASRPIKAGEQLHISYHTFDDEPYTTSELFFQFGIIEEMPQRWVIGNGLIFELDEVPNSSHEYQVKWVTQPSFYDNLFLEKELDRLKSLFHLKEKGLIHFLKHEEPHIFVSEHEWNVVWEYYEALYFAIEKAAEASNQNLSTSLRYTVSDKVLIQSEDDINNIWIHNVCDYEQVVKHGIEDFFVERSESPFQKLDVVLSNSGDLCFRLDDRIHTCASFRPPMHEIYVHFPVAYLKSLKRVAFIGGGDSMVLHEILKYPSVNYILGMELDINVVRQSFKHFHSEPHFDDPQGRVNWIFGDATKTLQLLPKDYFQSFDLVVVDLSIEVMNLPVGDKINLFQASSLLTNEDGIFMINDNFFVEVGKVYDHTLVIRFEGYPVHCHQYFVLGSDRNNFQEPNFQLMEEFKIENLFYSPLENISHHYAPIYLYSKNDNGLKRERYLSDVQKNDHDRKINDGILTILDIENSLASKFSLEEIELKVRKVVEGIDFTVINFFTDISDEEIHVLVAVLHEGYVIVRTLSRFAYTTIDFHLWDNLHLEENVKKALIKTFGGNDGPVSSFSVIVGGLGFEDKSLNSEPNTVIKSKSNEIDSIEQQCADRIDTSNILIEEGIELTSKDRSGIVVIFCGEENDESCTNLDKLKNDFGKSVIAVYSSSLQENNQVLNNQRGGKDITRVSLSNQTLETALRSLVSEDQRLQFLFIDSFASADLVYDFGIILSEEKEHRTYLDLNFILMVPTDGMMDENREGLLHRGRKKIRWKSVSLSQIVMGCMEHHRVDVLRTGLNTTYPDMRDFIAKVETRVEYKVWIQDWKGSLPQFPADIDHDKYNYTVNDYDTSDARMHFSNQNQLATQQLVKITLNDCSDSRRICDMSADKIVSALEHFSTLFSPIQSLKVEVVEHAIIIVTFMSQGQVITTWDGKSNINMNIFMNGSYDHEHIAQDMMKKLDGKSVQINSLHPRGTGRVVTFE